MVREIREETGVDAEVIRLASVSWKPRNNEILFQFVCRIVAGEQHTTDESDDFGYFPLHELPQQLGRGFRRRLFEWSKAPDQALLITDDGPSTLELLRDGLL